MNEKKNRDRLKKREREKRIWIHLGGLFSNPHFKKRKQLQPGMVVYTFNHNTQEVERQVDLCELKTILIYIFNPGLYSKTLSQTNKQCVHHQTWGIEQKVLYTVMHCLISNVL